MPIRTIVTVAVLGFLSLAPRSQAALNAEQRLNDFAQLVSTIERSYGPLHLKKKTVALDFRQEVESFKVRIAAAKSDAQFYQLLSRFLARLKDGHVVATVPSNFQASLGFVTDLVAGKVLIESIDRLRLPEVLFPFQRGDQLLAIDGVPVERLITELNEQSNTGNDQGSLRIAAARLTSRKESGGFAVPKGVATISVLPKGAAVPVVVTATWITSGTPLLELDDLSGFSDDLGAVSTALDGEDLLREMKKLSLFNLALPRAAMEDFERIGLGDIGSPKSMFTLPEGAVEIPGMPVTAAIFAAAGKRIGILRINSYMNENLLQSLGRALQVMETQTDVLVLDQTNNPGGSVALVSDIAGLFADRSFIDVNFQIRPSLQWINTFDGLNGRFSQTLALNPKDEAANALKARFQFLAEEMRDAIREKRFLTKPVSLNLSGTFGTIQPNRVVRYTKPVLLLINELDFSGGDAFPSIMKDNGRATLFGAKTNGAGGNVNEFGPLANSFFRFSLTESLMVRPNGAYVENQGIQPDVAFDITEDDFMKGYRGYVKAFTVEALKMAGAAEADIEAFKAK